jgi:hypothetical protein
MRLTLRRVLRRGASMMVVGRITFGAAGIVSLDELLILDFLSGQLSPPLTYLCAATPVARATGRTVRP